MTSELSSIDLSQRTTVTFVIPAYNSESTIIQTLESIFGQTLLNSAIHAIVIDDGSSDRTGEAVQHFMQHHPDRSIELIQIEHGGEAHALNHGIARRRGGYVAIVESDVEISNTWLERCLAALQEDGVAGAGGFLRGKVPAPWIARLAALEVERKLESQHEYPVHITSANALYRASIFDSVGIFQEQFYNATLDADFNARIIQAGYRLRFVQEAEAWHTYKSTLWTYLKRYYWYGRYRSSVRQGALYPCDRFITFQVLTTASAYLALVLFHWIPWFAVGLWCLVIILATIWTLQIGVMRYDRALWLFPIVLVARNSAALAGIAWGIMAQALTTLFPKLDRRLRQ